MAFQNELFPSIKLIHGVSKSIIDPVSIISNGNTEYRVKKNRYARFTWSIPSNNLNEEDKLEINAFLSDKDHGLDSFKFTDPDLSTLSAGLMSSAGTDTWFLNIPHDTNNAGKHPIFHSSNLTATKNGLAATIASTSLDSNGRPILTITGSIPSDVIRITGNFYFAVRLDSSTGWSLKALTGTNTPDIVGYSEIKLIEVFEQ